jgi:DNA-binding protein HU-beta
MTKTELQVALAAATETNKRTAGVFLNTLCILTYKETRKNGEFVIPGFGKLGEAEEKGSRRLQSEDAAKDQDSS